jgi:uncharacterized membrane protein
VKTKLNQLDIASLALIAGMAALTGAVYARLPERVPTHFDGSGVANGWMNRFPGAWIIPLTALGLWLLLRPGARLLPTAWRARMDQSPVALVVMLVTLLCTSIHCVTLYAALAEPAPVGVYLGVPLGVFWFVSGLVLPRVRRNPWMGIRTPWTLSSDENWARTHRVAGHAFCIAGVLTVVGTLLTHSLQFGIAAILTSCFVPAVYSFVLARRLPPEA